MFLIIYVIARRYNIHISTWFNRMTWTYRKKRKSRYDCNQITAKRKCWRCIWKAQYKYVIHHLISLEFIGFVKRSIADFFLFGTWSDMQKHRNRFDTPQDYIAYLCNPDLSVHKIYSCMESLRIALTNNPLTWVHDFVCEGLNQVLTILNECYRRSVAICQRFH